MMLADVAFMHHADPIGFIHSQRVDMMHQTVLASYSSWCINAVLANEHEALGHHVILKVKGSIANYKRYYLQLQLVVGIIAFSLAYTHALQLFDFNGGSRGVGNETMCHFSQKRVSFCQLIFLFTIWISFLQNKSWLPWETQRIRINNLMFLSLSNLTVPHTCTIGTLPGWYTPNAVPVSYSLALIGASLWQMNMKPWGTMPSLNG